MNNSYPSVAAFDYQFGAMDHAGNALGKAYSNLMYIYRSNP